LKDEIVKKILIKKLEKAKKIVTKRAGIKFDRKKIQEGWNCKKNKLKTDPKQNK